MKGTNTPIDPHEMQLDVSPGATVCDTWRDDEGDDLGEWRFTDMVYWMKNKERSWQLIKTEKRERKVDRWWMKVAVKKK
jgi:hypothetical protein